MSAVVIQFPGWLVEEMAGCFRAFDDQVKGELIILPCVRFERPPEKPKRKSRGG